jgi:dipeptidyl aminopeptidase/acylaminoacyl peptidase
MNYFDAVRVPVLILQGTADATTPPVWAEAIRDALQVQHAAVDYAAFPGQGHIFTSPAWDDAMAKTLAFLDAHVRAGRAARR